MKDTTVRITENTYVSLGLLVMLLGAAVWIGKISNRLDQLEANQAQVMARQQEGLAFRAQFDKRITILEVKAGIIKDE